MSTWYTITVVEHDDHPLRSPGTNMVEIVSCTVLPNLAGSVLRTVAEQVDPQKPVTRGQSNF